MHYIVALGNPGEKYQHSRHNVGWIVGDVLCTAWALPTSQKQTSVSRRVSSGQVLGQDISLLYPDTYMNNSGTAVRKLVPASQLAQLIVLYDDVDLPLGDVRVSFGRGAGGHNGMTSIIEKLGTKDFIRVRLGIGKVGFWPWQSSEVKRPAVGGPLERYVLGNFTKRELETVIQMAKQAQIVIETIITDGHVAAMNRFN